MHEDNLFCFFMTWIEFTWFVVCFVLIPSTLGRLKEPLFLVSWPLDRHTDRNKDGSWVWCQQNLWKHMKEWQWRCTLSFALFATDDRNIWHRKCISRVSDQNGVFPLYIEGSQPEWCILSMINSRDTPFWSGTLDIMLETHHSGQEPSIWSRYSFDYLLMEAGIAQLVVCLARCPVWCSIDPPLSCIGSDSIPQKLFRMRI